ncbi:SRPBCC family protein [bacterium BMS3Abin03]|nr:SRPBCC family protein [bacterium BMS3Abin03]MCG6960678.1 SRPBCC family protein [bacterium BMS3Abin03]
MKIFQIKSKQTLNITLEESWDFFSNPRNLPKITPPWLKLKVTSNVPEKMYAGMIITYKVYPFLGIPSNWVTEITQVKEKNFFIDEQRFGPYKFWHHQHHFRESDKGIEMEDIVTYALPFDPLSRSVNNLLVGKKVKEIFDHREKVLSKLFPD